MGFWNKVKKAAKKVSSPVASATKKIEKVSRPLTRPVRDATKFAVKGTPFEATVRSLTDFDVRKPHVGVARIGYATAANMAAEATGGLSLRITNEIDRKLYGRSVGTMTPGAISDPQSVQTFAKQRIGQAKAYGIDQLKGMQRDVARGNFSGARARLDGLRSKSNAVFGSPPGGVSPVRQAIRPQSLRREGAPPSSLRTSNTLNRLAGGGGGMPLAASTLAAMGVGERERQAASLAPSGHNNMLLYGLAAAGVAVVLLKRKG